MRLSVARRQTFVEIPEQAALTDARGILLDWDGCVAVGANILPGARRLIAAKADRIAILSNNSTHLPEDIAGVLARERLTVTPERIILAGVETIRWAATQRSARVLLLAAPRLRAYARSRGLKLVRDDPDLVLLLRDTHLTYAKLERAVDAVAAGAPLVAANADRTHPGPGGRLIPETGALLAALTTCVPGVKPLTIGKPGPMLFEKACAALGVDPADAVMIGDNPETDGAGADALGMRSIIVDPASGDALDSYIA